jgi:hypothetical protein
MILQFNNHGKNGKGSYQQSIWRNGTISKKITVEATIQGKINSKVFTPKLPLALDEGSTSPLSQWSGQAYCAKT